MQFVLPETLVCVMLFLVLSYIINSNGVEEAVAVIGEQVNLTCDIAIQDGGNITFIWRLDGNEHICGIDSVCYLSDTYSVLQIENTSTLGLGFHVVEGFLQQTLPQRFMGDPQFDTVFSKKFTLKITSEFYANPTNVYTARIMKCNHVHCFL